MVTGGRQLTSAWGTNDVTQQPGPRRVAVTLDNWPRLRSATLQLRSNKFSRSGVRNSIIYRWPAERGFIRH